MQIKTSGSFQFDLSHYFTYSEYCIVKYYVYTVLLYTVHAVPHLTTKSLKRNSVVKRGVSVLQTCIGSSVNVRLLPCQNYVFQ